MLAYILAIAVALASLTLYTSAFFLPELHRKDDFWWSSVGLFYALVLWVCAGRITGGVLLGQTAAVALVLSLGWQTLRLRRAIAHPEEQNAIANFSFTEWLQKRVGSKPKKQPIPAIPKPETATSASQPSPAQPEKPKETIKPQTEPVTVDFVSETSIPETIEAVETVIEETSVAPIVEETWETLKQETPPEAVSAVTEAIASAQKKSEQQPKQGFSLRNLFGLGKQKPASQAQPAKEPVVPPQEAEEDWQDKTELDAQKDTSETTEPEPSEINWEDENEVSAVEISTIDVVIEETITITNREETVPSSDLGWETAPIDEQIEIIIEEYQPSTETIEEVAITFVESESEAVASESVEQTIGEVETVLEENDAIPFEYLTETEEQKPKNPPEDPQ